MDKTLDFYKTKTLLDSEELPPKTIGPYQIKKTFALGGMSRLYLASHPQITKPLLIKVLLPKFLDSEEILSRFLKEAEIISSSNHPNIVRLYGYGNDAKGPYIAMELIDGVSLRKFIEKETFSQKKALEIIQQIGYALHHLHSYGIIHRDLKPENILITKSGGVKLIDFGIAEQKKAGDQAKPTQKKRLMGTPFYMSPEQKQSQASLTPASDIYSLGIISYELILQRLSHGIIQLKSLPEYLRPIIEKALCPNPEKRPSHVSLFVTDLSQQISLRKEEISSPPSDKESLFLKAEIKSILVPTKPPLWPHFKIDISLSEEEFSSGLYLDFIEFMPNQFGIVIAEPLDSGVETLTQTTVFRGVFRAALEQHKQPIQVLHTVNSCIKKDPFLERFCLALLILDPNKNELTFISCKSSDLKLISEENTRILKTPNVSLGTDHAPTFLVTMDPFQIGDLIFLSSNKKQKPSLLISINRVL